MIHLFSLLKGVFQWYDSDGKSMIEIHSLSIIDKVL